MLVLSPSRFDIHTITVQVSQMDGLRASQSELQTEDDRFHDVPSARSDLLRAVLNFETVSVNSTFVLLPLDFS